MADDEDEVAPYGYGRYGTRSKMLLLFSEGGSDDDTEGSSTSSGSYASVGMPLSRLLISVPGGRRSRLSTGSGSSYNMIGSLIQMLMSSPAMDESSDETEPLPLPPAKGENKNQSESSKGEGQKPRNSDEEIDRLRKILEQGGQKQTVKNKTEEEKKGESSDATGQEIEHEPSQGQGNLQEVDEVKVEDQHLSQLETASEEHDMKSDITTIDITDKESGDKNTETAGPAVSMETIQKDEILPLSQQLKKDADQSMNFLKSLWSAPVDNSLVSNSNISKPLTKRGESTEKVLETSHVQPSTFQYHHKDNIPREKPVVDNINSSAAGNISRSLSEDGVISPGERLKPNFQDAENLFNKPSRSISLTEQDLSDGDSVEEDCDYSNDLGGQLPEHDLDKEASKVKGQASDQSSPIELPCENNEKMFKSKHKDDFYKAQESAEEAVKVLEKEVNKQKMKGDNSSGTEPGDLKSDDNTKPVTSSQQSTDQNIKSSQFSPDSYDDDFGGDYDERYGYSPMNSKYAKLAKSPLATQISRLTGVMSGLQSLAEQHGFEIKDVTPDGNCMFSALVDQLRICGNFDFSTQSLRKAAVSYLRDNPYHEDGTHLQSFLYRETWDKYLQRMEQETVWGDHMVLQACTEVLECKIYVYKPSTNETVLAPNSTEADESSDLFLGHVGESHFVSLRRTDWEKLWHLKAQIHRNRKRNRNLTHKYLKSTAKMNSLKKKAQALKKEIENISQDSSLPSEISTDQQEKMSQDVDGQDEITSASNTINRQSSSTSEQDHHIEDTVSLAEEMEIEDEPEETESFGACSDVKTLVENCNAFDNDSQLPLPHISYLIDNLLRTDYMCVSDSTVEFKTKGGFCQLAGSIPEGFDIYLRNYNRKAKSVQMYTEKYPKLIRIFADGEVHLSQEGRKGYYDLILEQSNCHSGYTNLRPFRPDLWSKRVFHSDDNKPLLTHMIMSISSSKSSLMSKNAFSGYRCIEWPKEAAEWLTRDRLNGWPNKDVMRIIKSTDCLVISRAHPLTENKGIEWQIIFPQAEQILANECLTKHQLYCFKVFKILVNFHCREKSSAFTTTHLKTVLFYACEEIPTQCWSENIGGCVLYLLDKFLMFIMTRNVPNYFIPINNMIDHLPESDLKFYEEKVHALRMFPVMSLYVLAEEHGINQVQILIDPILDDAKRYKTDIPRTGMAKEVFVTTTMKLAMYFMGFEYYSEGCNIAQKAYEDLLLLETDNEANKTASPAMSFQDFILKFLQEECEEDKYTYAVEFDKRLQTRLYRELQNGDEVVTLEDIVGKELAGSLSYIPIPKSYTENTIALVGYIDELARRHFVKSKLEDSACLLRCAISKAKLFHEEMVDVSQLEDQEIKEKVSKQNYRKMSSMNCKIMQIYHHLYTCYNAMGQVELIQEYIHDFEEVCERTGQPYYYKDLADIWQALGETEKSREIRKKLKTLRSSSIPEETWL